MTTKQSKTTATLAEELVTVRHMATGLYMRAAMTDVRISAVAAGDDGAPYNMTVKWSVVEDASILTRKIAAAVSAAYIAMTGDAAVEIEPVEVVL